ALSQTAAKVAGIVGSCAVPIAVVRSTTTLRRQAGVPTRHASSSDRPRPVQGIESCARYTSSGRALKGVRRPLRPPVRFWSDAYKYSLSSSPPSGVPHSHAAFSRPVIEEHRPGGHAKELHKPLDIRLAALMSGRPLRCLLSHLMLCLSFDNGTAVSSY